MKRLYISLYLAFSSIVFVSLLVAALAFHLFGGDPHQRSRLARGIAELVVETLPETGDPSFRAALASRAQQLSVELSLWDASGRAIAHTTPEPIPFPPHRHRGFFHAGHTPGFLIELPDGRWFGALLPGGPARERFFPALALFALVAALGCYPLARGITRRLEALESTVQSWGEGALDRRSAVRGKDEIARLAASFNAAAQRIESLVAQQRRVLASASHELRSPLSRLRMALELMPEASSERRAELARQSEADVEELDALIEDLLLASRADASFASRQFQPVELFDLFSEETARSKVPFAGESVTIEGDRRMLRRLIRNLLENAQRHGGGRDVRAALALEPDRVKLVIEDRGPGVPEAERERIFEPFYRPAGHRETEGGGVGLGLALVRQLAEHHGGKAWYEERSGGGSRFIVELPRTLAGATS